MKRLRPAPTSLAPIAPPGYPSPARLEFLPATPDEPVVRMVADPVTAGVTPYDDHWYPGRPVRP